MLSENCIETSRKSIFQKTNLNKTYKKLLRITLNATKKKHKIKIRDIFQSIRFT